MGLSTHVLDTMNGCPAAGMAVELFSTEGDKATLIKSLVLNHDGRTDAPLFDNNTLKIPGRGEFTGIKTMILLEVEGAGDYLPSYSGNLDIMTAAAKATGELLAERIRDGKKVVA